jgi:hypothetical protein
MKYKNTAGFYSGTKIQSKDYRDYDLAFGVFDDW